MLPILALTLACSAIAGAPCAIANTSDVNITLSVDGRMASPRQLRITLCDGMRSVDVAIHEGRFMVPDALHPRAMRDDSATLLVVLSYQSRTAIIGELPAQAFKGTWDVRVFHRPFHNSMVRDALARLAAADAETVFQIRYMPPGVEGDLPIFHYPVGRTPSR